MNDETKNTGDILQTHHAHLGPILSVLILALILIFTGLYLWGGMLAEEAMPQTSPTIINNEPETPRATADQQIFETVSTSDELDAIEADVNSTRFDSLDTDLTTIDAELGT